MELDRENAYIKKWNEFKAANIESAKTSIGAEISKLTHENYEFQFKTLEQNGVDVSKIKEELKYIYRYSSTDLAKRYPRIAKESKTLTELEPEVVVTQLIADFKKNAIGGDIKKGAVAKGRIESLVHDKLKADFVKREGAWDNTWVTESSKQTGYGEQGRKTLKEEFREELKKSDEERRKLEGELLSSEKKTKSGSDEHGDSKNIQNLAYGVAGGLAKQVVGGLLGDDAKEKYKKPIALDRILHLRRIVEQPKDNPDWKPPEEVPPVTTDSGKKGGESKEKSMSYTQFVHEIFQQHQRDCKRVDIGERYFSNFEKVRWDDKKIMEMSDNDLTAYEYAVKTLAKRIKDGRMDALALVELVGNPQGKKIETVRQFLKRNIKPPSARSPAPHTSTSRRPSHSL
jgi:hypothetical protein